MTYGELGYTLGGIDMSLAGDEMLFPETNPTTARQFLRDLVLKVRKNESEKKGVSLDEQFNLPPETLLDESSVTIFNQGLEEMDRAMKEALG